MSLVAWPTPSANSYSSRAAADIWMADRLNTEAYTSATTTKQDQALITATDFLDSQSWDGDKTVSSQPLEFPRTGLSDKNGDAVDSATLPPELVEAHYLLTLAILKSSQVQFSSGTRVSGITTANTAIRFSIFGEAINAGGLPNNIQQLIAIFLSKASASSLVESFGTDVVSGIEKYERNRGFG